MLNLLINKAIININICDYKKSRKFINSYRVISSVRVSIIFCTDNKLTFQFFYEENVSLPHKSFNDSMAVLKPLVKKL